MQPKVSVIMPAYNAERWIEKAVKAVLSQTYKNIELIVINDGSDDKTQLICEMLQREDERIIIHLQNNQGLCSARNQGMKLISGDYFIIVDSDDILDSDAVSLLVKTAETKNADIVIGGYWYDVVGTEKKILRTVSENFEFYPNNKLNTKEVEMLVKSCTIAPTWNKLYRKSFSNRSFDTQLAINEDLLFSLQAVKSAKKVAVVSTPVYDYIIQNTNSLSRKFHPEFPESIDKIFCLICDETYKTIRSELTIWLMDLLFVYIRNVCINRKLSRSEKVHYIQQIKKTSMYKECWRIKFATTYGRKLCVLLMHLNLDFLYITMLDRKGSI